MTVLIREAHTVELKLFNARLIINQIFPFYSSILTKVRFRPKEGIGTLACDSQARVYYDPALTWNQAEINFVLLHEIGHLVKLHFQRWEHKEGDEGKKVNHKIANIAGDCEINNEAYQICHLDPDNFQFPQGGQLPTHYGLPDKHLAEYYYDELMKSAKKITVTIDCGSAADGMARDYEDGDDGTGLSQEELEDIAAQVQEELDRWGREVKNSEASTSTSESDKKRHAKGIGNRPEAGSFSILPALLKGRIWLDRARKVINEYTRLKVWGFARPNRRYSNPPFIMPGRGYHTPQVAFLCDVSGSINMTSAHQGFKVIDQLKGLGIKCRIFACDTRAFEVTDRSAVYTGGGTHLPAGLELIQNTMGSNVDLCIVISDGQTSWDTRPPFPVVMLTWDEEGPKWMRTIKMPEL